MKKPMAILVALFGLIVIIGFERFVEGLQLSILDGRHEPPEKPPLRPEFGVEDSLEVLSPRSDQNGQFGDRFSRSSASLGVVPAPSDQSDPGLAGTPFVVEGTGQWTSLHFVRSSEITGKAEMSPSEIDRLQRAVEIFGDEWDSGALIFDSDALSSSTIPLVLFAEEGCDLTEQVKSIYEQLLAEEGSSKEER